MEKHKICIVDDHILFQKGMSELVNDFQDCEVLFEACNGLEFISKLKLSESIPDLVLLDVEMPEMNGEETTTWISENYPSIGIIILTMHDEEKYLLRLLDKGAKGYLRKNATPEEVEKAILCVTRGEYFLNNSILSAMLRKKEKKSGKTEFTDRELEVLQFICKGEKSVSIAEKMFISIRTVEGHRQRLLEKSGSRNSAELVAFAVKNNLF